MSNIVQRAVMALAALAVASAALAATYRWTDAQGVVHYSDTPQPGAQEIQLPSAQTYRAPPVPAAPPAAAASTPAAAPVVYQTCAITQPAADSNLFAPEVVNVSVQVIPALRPGDQLSVTLDGATLPPSGSSGMNFALPSPERGSHTVSALVLGADGQTLCSAPPVSFSVQRPSLLSPQSPAKGH
jgi:Domain of unknown function (DUF4124)